MTTYDTDIIMYPYQQAIYNAALHPKQAPKKDNLPQIKGKKACDVIIDDCRDIETNSPQQNK